MNTRIVKILMSVSLLVLLLGIAVQAQEIKVEGKIPFAFTVGDVAMPAGEYDVTKLNMAMGVFRVRDLDCKNVAVRAVMPLYRAKIPTETVLVFNRYQENGGEVSYFLSQVWLRGMEAGYEFIKHPVERATAKRATNRDIIALVIPRSKNAAD